MQISGRLKARKINPPLHLLQVTILSLLEQSLTMV